MADSASALLPGVCGRDDSMTITTTIARSVLGIVVVAVGTLLSAPTAEAQAEPVLSFEGRVTSVSPREMLVAAEREGVVVDVVMVDLARIPQSETRQIAQDDIVVVVGFIRRPGHKVIATSVQPVSRWFPTSPAWERPVPLTR
jgi:hypothetical protein